MAPDSLSFLTLITKLRVIPCSAFGVLQNTPPAVNLFSRKTRLVIVHDYGLTSVFGFRYLQKLHVKKKEEKTNSNVIKQLTSRISESGTMYFQSRLRACNTNVLVVGLTSTSNHCSSIPVFFSLITEEEGEPWDEDAPQN